MTRRRVLAWLLVTVLSTGNAMAAHLWQNLELRQVDGDVLDTDSLSGKVVLIDFWATWCAPCLAEIPELKRLRDRHGGRGLEILGVNFDPLGTPRLRRWLSRNEVVWPQVQEQAGFDGPLARTFDVESLPRNALIDSEGRTVAIDLRGSALEAAVLALLHSTSGRVSASQEKDLHGKMLAQEGKGYVATYLHHRSRSLRDHGGQIPPR